MKSAVWLMMAVLLSLSVFANSLDEYPDMYVSNGNVNVIVVVGNDAPASYVIVQTGIALSLNEEAHAQQQGVAKLASEVSELSQNTISIGNPCENDVSARILGNPINCLTNYKKGIARIEMVYDEEQDLTHIVAGGFTEKGTIEAAKRVKDASKNSFGKFTIIEFAVDEPLEIEIEEETQEVPTNDITQKEQETVQEIEEQPASPAKEPSLGQQEAAETPKENQDPETGGVFGKFVQWLRSLFG